MHKMLLIVAATASVLFTVSSANAFTCFSNSFATGCTGHLGSWAVTRQGAVAVGPSGDVHAWRNGDGFYAYHRGSACYWHNGEQICR
jgi:type IV secretory pathway VirB6-like protein